jgi:hypothetical protein
LPQVRCFRYGEAEQSCITSLTKAFTQISRDQAARLIEYVPRYVAVVANVADPTWTSKLSGLDVQFLVVSVYANGSGKTSYGLEGQLQARSESLGFAQFSATDNCLRISRQMGLGAGAIQVVDQFGSIGDWTVRDSGSSLWLCKTHGPALIPHNSYVQIVRSHDGHIVLRPCRTP